MPHSLGGVLALLRAITANTQHDSEIVQLEQIVPERLLGRDDVLGTLPAWMSFGVNWKTVRRTGAQTKLTRSAGGMSEARRHAVVLLCTATSLESNERDGESHRMLLLRFNGNS